MAQTKADPFNIARDEMLNFINSRELTTREITTISQNPREVLKDKKIERYNNISRLSEENVTPEVSSETCPLAQRQASDPVALTSSGGSLESGTSCQEASGYSNSGTARTSIRGITAQHSRTDRGIKVMINIQTEADAETGSVVELTAELKRSDRLRELKSYQHDSPEFDQQVFRFAMRELTSIPARDRKQYCIGRLHERGVRDTWFADMLAIGILDSDDHLQTVLLNINGEEFSLDMSHPLSPRQQTAFHSGGIWGEIVNQRSAPTLQTAKRKVWP
jgi:hypothetical protein